MASTLLSFYKGRNQQIVQQSQGINALLKLNIEETNPPLMAYCSIQTSCGEVIFEFIIILNYLVSISLFVFPLLEVL